MRVAAASAGFDHAGRLGGVRTVHKFRLFAGRQLKNCGLFIILRLAASLQKRKKGSKSANFAF
jgi:hypothetical protein